MARLISRHRAAGTALLEAGNYAEARDRLARARETIFSDPPLDWLHGVAEALAAHDFDALRAIGQGLPESQAREVLTTGTHTDRASVAHAFLGALRREGAWR